ncbi:ABC transporter permease [Amylibacter marinus]|uniref:ABC transporter permease n=1 Tax=Amylibacter marinus TaxID=1475483 RepID=A0ABQ5VYD2_9RHOB|nr:ABC transporter permease subunit [Amylibacter marinus]GLQ36280.1 ABC transporter permease [Amylibacter marinus]
MFEYCADPKILEGFQWWSCYLTTVKHMNFYTSFLVVFALLAATVPIILVFGFAGAIARRSRFAPLRWLGWIYTSMVRGVPDIIFFLFVPIAMDQGIEYLRHQVKCSDWAEPIRQGNDFVVCAAAKMPLSISPNWVHETYGFFLAALAFAIVFGAFAANTIHGALGAVPHAQLETAAAYGMSRRQVFRRIQLPQMWVYALPGLSNLWMILIKATPLLFLLGVEDIVYWARELGGTKTSRFAYPHPDWRLGYFLVLMVFYLGLAWVSEVFFERMMKRLTQARGMSEATQ